MRKAGSTKWTSRSGNQNLHSTRRGGEEERRTRRQSSQHSRFAMRNQMIRDKRHAAHLSWRESRRGGTINTCLFSSSKSHLRQEAKKRRERWLIRDRELTFTFCIPSGSTGYSKWRCIRYLVPATESVTDFPFTQKRKRTGRLNNTPLPGVKVQL
ncbi:hypothetical protein BDZ45DRAFT_807317 [Acephala macrosclerotiorum]|nr:hypothetical protein BDZ45DRAFT_807317 [Acephala macrosclerotiorum]